MARKNPWDRAAPLEVGDAAAQVIYTSVGIALSWFEVLQARVSWLFEALIRTKGEDSMALLRAFGTTESVPPRANMIRAAAEVRFMNAPESRKKVATLMTQLVELSHRRNEIAHGYVTKYTENGKEQGHFLHPGSHITNRNVKFLQFDGDALGDYRYTAAQVDDYTREFRRLGGEIQDFIDEIRSKTAAE